MRGGVRFPEPSPYSFARPHEEQRACLPVPALARDTPRQTSLPHHRLQKGCMRCGRCSGDRWCLQNTVARIVGSEPEQCVATREAVLRHTPSGEPISMMSSAHITMLIVQTLVAWLYGSDDLLRLIQSPPEALRDRGENMLEPISSRRHIHHLRAIQFSARGCQSGPKRDKGFCATRGLA